MTDDDPSVLFIGGAGRSGSTLLECMLDEAPGAVAAGELTHLWDRGMGQDQLCGCGRPFSECPFWQDVVRRAWGDAPPASPSDLQALRRRALGLPGAWVRPRSRRRYLALLAALYRAIADVAGATVVIDSSKYPAEGWLLRGLATHGIRVAWVHLVREPNAVVHSWQRKRRRPEVHGRLEHMPRYPWWKTTGAWILFNLAFDVLARVEPGAVLRVRYRDLVSDPASVLEAVRGHAGLDPAPLGFVAGTDVTLTSNHTVSGNPSRFRTGEITLRPDVEWRERAPRWQVAAVNVATAWQRRKYGLSDRSRS